jgi:hypothetical protein
VIVRIQGADGAGLELTDDESSLFRQILREVLQASHLFSDSAVAEVRPVATAVREMWTAARSGASTSTQTILLGEEPAKRVVSIFREVVDYLGEWEFQSRTGFDAHEAHDLISKLDVLVRSANVGKGE